MLDDGRIFSEMDLSFQILKRIDENCKVGSNIYICHQNISMRVNESRSNDKYDFVVLYCPNGAIEQKQSPIIVAEFKVWRLWQAIQDDINKLEVILNQRRALFVHSMSIVITKTEESFKKLEKYVNECRNLGWEVCQVELCNGLISKLFKQCAGFYDEPNLHEFGWYPFNKKGILKNKWRKLIMLRLSKHVAMHVATS